MSRYRRMAHNVASSYAALVTSSLFSLATVPVALHYLGDETDRFALWLLMSTITGYMSLIDLGMSNAVARLLIDHKDQRDGGEYGSLIKTGAVVSLVQGAIILVAGIGLAPVLAWGLKIDLELRSEFIRLLGWQSVSLALTFATRIFSHVLTAHQRGDIQNYAQITGAALNFGLLWLFFGAGQGVFSLAWASLLTNFYGALVCLVAGWRMKVYPQHSSWGKVSGVRFRELFAYGQDMFLVALGTQMILASQILIIQRSLGSVAATMWGLGTRLFSLVSQLIWRISDTAGPAFSEMIVRGERDKLRARYQEMVILTASLSGFCAVGFALSNSVFVTVWTQGKVSWPAVNDLALGGWMIVLSVLHCHNGFVLLTKQVGFMRFVYFVEGLIFVGVALLTAKTGGLLAIIGCSIGCSLLLSWAYGVRRMHRYFQVSLYEVAVGWMRLMARTLLLYVPLALAIWWLGSHVEQPFIRLVVLAGLFAPVGAWIFLRYGTPESFQRELSARAPRFVVPVLRKILLTT